MVGKTLRIRAPKATEQERPFRRPISLSEDQRLSLVRYIEERLKAYSDDTASLMSLIQRWNDLVENVVPPKTTPWVGASNLSIPLVTNHMLDLHAHLRRQVLEQRRIWVGESDDPEEAFAIPDMEAFANWAANVQLNDGLTLKDKLSDVLWLAARDGLSVLQLDWSEQFDHSWDVDFFTTVEDFLARFPSAKESGISEDRYQTLIRRLIDDGRLMVESSLEEKVFDGPRAGVVELQDFAYWPLTATSITPTSVSLVGKKFRVRVDDIKRRQQAGLYYPELGEEDVKPETETLNNPLKQQQANIEGISSDERISPDGRGMWELAVRFDLLNTGTEQLYHVVFDPTAHLLRRVARWPMVKSRLIWIPFVIRRRANRLLGFSVPALLEDLKREIDTQHNQRIDSRSISTVPSFKAKNELKNVFDPSRSDSRFKPGFVLYLDNFADVDQFQIRPTDLGESIQEEANLFGLADRMTGVGSLRSGAVQQEDKRAPATKTLALLGQADIRLDDYVKDIRPAMEQVIRHVFELYYQYGPDQITFGIEDSTGAIVKKEISRAKFRLQNTRLRFVLSSSDENADREFQELSGKYAVLLQSPVAAQNAALQKEVWKTLLMKSRVPNRKRLLELVDQASLGPAPGALSGPVTPPGATPPEAATVGSPASQLQQSPAFKKVAGQLVGAGLGGGR